MFLIHLTLFCSYRLIKTINAPSCKCRKVGRAAKTMAQWPPACSILLKCILMTEYSLKNTAIVRYVLVLHVYNDRGTLNTSWLSLTPTLQVSWMHIPMLTLSSDLASKLQDIVPGSVLLYSH